MRSLHEGQEVVAWLFALQALPLSQPLLPPWWLPSTPSMPSNFTARLLSGWCW
jgi:hypothetical protein